MADLSPRAKHHLNDRRPIVDNSEGDTQSGKIPCIKETPRAEKANADINKRVLMEHDHESGEGEIG